MRQEIRHLTIKGISCILTSDVHFTIKYFTMCTLALHSQGFLDNTILLFCAERTVQACLFQGQQGKEEGKHSHCSPSHLATIQVTSYELFQIVITYSLETLHLFICLVFNSFHMTDLSLFQQSRSLQSSHLQSDYVAQICTS